jgi:predicted PurR-regulated permease PerM
VIIVLLAIIVALVLVLVPVVATAVARNVVNHLDRSPASGNIDQSIIEARLGRIEEAIDAMATQIEKLTDEQRALLGRRESER